MNATTEAIDAFDDSSISGKVAAQLEALRRRRVPMAIAFAVVLAIALLVAALLPAKYRSAGTILIEQQEIPEEFVRSAVTSFADQRVQMISQRVMTTTNLLEIIERHGLYGADRTRAPREQLIARVRRDIELEMISANVVDPRRGGVVKATIAFSVAFNDRSPELAARVANDLVSLYLRENLETRKALAAGSAQFLASEAERLRQRTEDLARKIAEFKREHIAQLPEFAAASLQQNARMAEELREIESRVRLADQQIVLLDAQLVQLDPKSDVTATDGGRVLGPADRLKALKAEHTAALARYSATHPDVRRMEREIGKLEREVPGGAGKSAEADADSTPDNPAYVQISAQREITLSERDSLVARAASLRQMISSAEQVQLRMPEIEREYRALLVEAQSEQEKYAEIRQKLLSAQLSQNLESEQKGERFTLIDPPVQPQEPVSPNRTAIRVVGLLLALAAAAAVLVAMEVFDTRVRGRRQVAALLGQPPLAVVPWGAECPSGPRFALDRTGLRRLVIGLAVAGTLGLLAIHMFLRPLDVVWAVLMRRLGA